MAFRYLPAPLQMMELKAKGCPGAGSRRRHPGAVSTLNGGACVALPASDGMSGKPRSPLGAGH